MKFPNFSSRRFLLCSDCFKDQGLHLAAQSFGFRGRGCCKQCGSRYGQKLGEAALHALAQDFFVNGTYRRAAYGGAPTIQYNKHQSTSIQFKEPLKNDAQLIAEALEVGFFHYGPRSWMVGEIQPLAQLQDENTREATIQKIIRMHPEVILETSHLLYRLRTKVKEPSNKTEYDGQPIEFEGTGRFDSTGLPMLYASQDIEICIHECRATVDDVIFVGTLAPTRCLRLLDLSVIIDEGDNITDFQRVDLALNMLFLAGKHSYPICRAIAKSAALKGFHGLIYPSSFSLLRSGHVPLETVYGLSYRQFPVARKHEAAKIIPNLAIFGRPVATGLLEVRNMNRLLLRQASYDFRFGPVEPQ